MRWPRFRFRWTRADGWGEINGATDGALADASTRDASVAFDPATSQGLLAWFSADRDVTVTSASNPTVTSWKDQASGVNATPVRRCLGPVRVLPPVGKPMVNFGRAQCLGMSTSKAPSPIAGLTVLVSTRMDAALPTFDGRLLTMYQGTFFSVTRSVSRFNVAAFAPDQFASAFSARTPLGDLTFASSKTQILSLRLATAGGGSTAEARLDGSPLALVAAPSRLPPLDYAFKALELGAGNNVDSPELDSFFGSLGEVLVFGRLLTPAEVSAAEAYLRVRWNT